MSQLDSTGADILTLSGTRLHSVRSSNCRDAERLRSERNLSILRRSVRSLRELAHFSSGCYAAQCTRRLGLFYAARYIWSCRGSRVHPTAAAFFVPVAHANHNRRLRVLKKLHPPRQAKFGSPARTVAVPNRHLLTGFKTSGIELSGTGNMRRTLPKCQWILRSRCTQRLSLMGVAPRSCRVEVGALIFQGLDRVPRSETIFVHTLFGSWRFRYGLLG